MYGIRQLIKRNLAFYRSHYRLVAVAVCVVTAVIIGSLLVGSSVRQTLTERVTERLGDTETIIFSRQSYFSEDILNLPLWKDSNAKGVLMLDGFVPSNGRLLPVVVFGTDDVPQGEAMLNPTLNEETGEATELTLRLPRQGMVPSGSLFVSQNYTTSLRLSVSSIREAKEGGDLSLKNEQARPMNIFVNRKELAEAMGAEGMINLLLLSQRTDMASLKEVWRPELGGISLEQKPNGWHLTSKRVFLQETIVDELIKNNPSANPLFTYLANSINLQFFNSSILQSSTIPYSFVTAIREYDGQELADDEIILSDYAARRLNAGIGDEVSISYFLANDLKDLSTDSITLKVKRIVPIEEWVKDGTLSADFPGMANVKRCTDWDSDLPIDMSLIKKEDETYWEHYRNTPKALLPYRVMAERWHGRWGTATAIRFSEQPDLSGLTPEMMGIEMIHPKEKGLQAAANGTDFSGLFLALGFFIILSALLLMINPLSEMMEERRMELHLLGTMGFTKRRIQGLLACELAPVVLMASVIGVLVGMLYTALIMWLLGSVWSGVTGTSGFHVAIDGWLMVVGWLVSVAVVGGLGYWSFSRLGLSTSSPKRPNDQSPKRLRLVLLLALTVVLLLLNIFLFNQSVLLFVLIGLLLLISGALLGDEWIIRKGRPHTNTFSTQAQTYGAILFARRQSLLSYFALALGVFTIFAVGLNRQRFSDQNDQATAHGLSLWCESRVPIYHDLNTREGRAKLGLQDLPEDVTIVQALCYKADDASCLNLNRVETPSVLGLDMALPTDGGVNIDEESLLWSMGKQVGDTLHYLDAKGEDAALPITAALPTGIFQGYALMSREAFLQLWPDQTGTRLMLVRCREDQTESVSRLLAQALSEYGVRVMTIGERQEQFLQVVNTYLGIFLLLGGIGMLVGIFSFIIVVRKNLLMRRNDIALYKTLGYSHHRIATQLFRENIIVPLYAIVAGTLAAVVSVCTHLRNADLWTGGMTVAILSLMIIILLLFTKKCVVYENKK